MIAVADMGKDGRDEGDVLDLGTTEPAPGDDPTSRIEYRTGEWLARRRPSSVRTLARDRHRAPDARWHESYAYLDGTGEEVLTKAQAEPGPAPARDAEGRLVHGPDGSLVLAEVTERWVGSGRTVYDSRGRAVRSYEPFFSSTFEYEDEADLVRFGVTPVVHYDPLGTGGPGRLPGRDVHETRLRRVAPRGLGPGRHGGRQRLARGAPGPGRALSRNGAPTSSPSPTRGPRPRSISTAVAATSLPSARTGPPASRPG